MFRNVAKVAAVATLMLSSAYGCKNFVRVKEDDCKKWMEHVTKVVVDDVKKQAKDCKLEKGAEDEVKEAIQNWVKDDCAKYDGDQYLLQKDHECMMKAESPADIDKCYDAIPQTKTSTTTKKVGKVLRSSRRRPPTHDEQARARQVREGPEGGALLRWWRQEGRQEG